LLAGGGFGAHRERDGLERWECGQDRVALIMHNDLYADMVIGCLKARTVPVNLNHNYTPREVAELLDYVKPRAVIYHRSLGAKFADVLPPDGADLLIAVDDGSDTAELPGSVAREDALAHGGHTAVVRSRLARREHRRREAVRRGGGDRPARPSGGGGRARRGPG
jgi:fatty-acyl-CoA synthase